MQVRPHHLLYRTYLIVKNVYDPRILGARTYDMLYVLELFLVFNKINTCNMLLHNGYTRPHTDISMNYNLYVMTEALDHGHTVLKNAAKLKSMISYQLARLNIKHPYTA